MRLEQLCEMDLHYVGGFHLARPYGGEDGLGWGIGEGTVSGERLSGTARWSNHPQRRGDGTMLPCVRGVIATTNEAEVLFDLSGRTGWVQREGSARGSQLLICLFESQAESYTWLNDTVCIVEGAIDPQTLAFKFRIFLCHNELV
jgi:hypothetical protein